MKIGFLILAHKGQQQCSLLIDALLFYPGAVVFIHVDLKAVGTYEALKSKYIGNKRVNILSVRYPVYWGSYNQVRATYELIKHASNHDLEYCSLLSGQDFPIQSIENFTGFLKTSGLSEFLVNFKLPDPQWDGEGGLNRLNFYWRNVKSREKSFFSDKLNALIWRFHKLTGYRRKLKYDYYGGSNWFTLTRAAIKHITEFVEKEPAYLAEFKNSRTADEIFVQSIIMNSPFKSKVISDDLRFIDWISGPEFPKVMRGEDFHRLISVKDKFFARKFDESVDLNILKQLDEHIRK